ncbi:MAG: PAS domain S-box protein [Candidatus Thorarchaeota archaeon]|nr:PAS domain S-box protein [Candidatus Thorarchaeota archaeon]
MAPTELDDTIYDFESLEELLKHRVLLESLSEGFGVVDENNIFSYVNKRFSDLLEYSNDEMIGHLLSDFLDDEEKLTQKHQIRKRTKGESSSYELTWTTKSGRKILTLISGVPILDKVGNYRGAFAVITDLTGYHAAEQKYKLLAEQSLQGLTVIQFDRYVYVNPAFCRMVGYSREEILNMPPNEAWDLIYQDDKKKLLEIAQNRKEGKPIPMPYEYRFIRRDGSIRWVQAFSGNIDYEGSSAVQVLIIDITEAREFEENLRNSEAKYRSLAVQSPQGIIIMGDNKFLYHNPAFKELIGYDDEELSQMDVDAVWNLVHPDDREELTKRMQDKIAGRAVAPRYEYRYMRKNGEIRWVESFSSQVEYNGRSAIQTVIVDISDRRQSERELRSAKDRAVFYLDLMGHDLTQQLQVILNSAALMKNATDSSVKESFYKIIGDAVKRSSRIIQEAKSTEQLLSVPLIERSLTQAVNICIEAMSHAENITFETYIMGGEAKVLADEYLELLISNILMNAIEHNVKERKRVWIRLDSSGLDYLLSISDDGPGIPDSTKAGLFDMSRRFGGLGLHTVNHLVEKYRGQIKVQDRVNGNYTQGLEVRIWLPKLIQPK